ncbi:MAG: hypothetical protein KDC87_21260 [Planctomycetes bacterium]|nr:hypothetical protein [Planctomycetota bacterium]
MNHTDDDPMGLIDQAFAFLREDPRATHLRSLPADLVERLRVVIDTKEPGGGPLHERLARIRVEPPAPRRLVEFLERTGTRLFGAVGREVERFRVAGAEALQSAEAVFAELAYSLSRPQVSHYASGDDVVDAWIYPRDPERRGFEAQLTVREAYYRAEGELSLGVLVDAQLVRSVPNLGRCEMVVKLTMELESAGGDPRSVSSLLAPIRTEPTAGGGLELRLVWKCPEHELGNGIVGKGLSVPVDRLQLFLFEGER